jgi:hypothetical protein
MKEVLLHDPKRQPVDWVSLVSPGQYAVFFTDVATSAPIRHDGTLVNRAAEHFCLLFDSLAEAERYCRDAINRAPRLKCEVFDSEGRKNAPVVVFVNARFEHKLDSEAKAQRLIRWGMISIVACLPFVMYAVWAGPEVVWWPMLLAINLFFLGLRLMHWGSALKEELRYRREDGTRRLKLLPARSEEGTPDRGQERAGRQPSEPAECCRQSRVEICELSQRGNSFRRHVCLRRLDP